MDDSHPDQKDLLKKQTSGYCLFVFSLFTEFP
ncbi:hypothetical protein IGI57_000080 [Enterococcus sp. DIV0213j]|jgi:hypothetical protein